MLKKFIICLLFVLIFVQPQVQAIKADNGKLVRVGISDNSFVNYYISSAKISATDEFKIVDKKTGVEIGVFPADKIVTAEMKDNFLNAIEYHKTYEKELLDFIDNIGFKFVIKKYIKKIFRIKR